MSDVVSFYDGASLLVTGITGYAGKVLLEKLLRTCPKINKIFVLVRTIRGKSSDGRVEDLLKSYIFDRVRKENPEALQKVVVIPGDLKENGLALSKSDRAQLCNEVDTFLHLASCSSMQHDEPLKTVIETNVLGVQQVLELTSQMKKLKAFVYLSSAYANCDRHEIQEYVYPPPIEPKKILDAVSWMDEATVQQLAPEVLGSKANTYTFSLSLAEHILASTETTFPVAIVRPSIIGAAWREPFPGWVENNSGATGLLAAVGKGRLRVMKGKRRAIADFVPVDTVANLLLSAPYKISGTSPGEPVVFNCTSGQLKKLTWGEMEKLSYDNFMKNPFLNLWRVPDPTLTSHGAWRTVKVWYDHYLPAYLLDALLWLSGSPTRYVKNEQEILKSVDHLEYFTSRDWIFTNQNFTAIHKDMSEADRKLFPVNVAQLHWPSYMEQYCLGIKKYLVGEPLSTLPVARKQLKRLRIFKVLVKTLTVLLIWRFLWRHVPLVKVIVSFLLRLPSIIFMRKAKN